MKKLILLFPVILLFLISCTITQTYQFNKDFSGSSRVEIDASSYVSLMGISDTTGNPASYIDTISQYFYQAAYFLNNCSGISNVKWDMSEETSILFISFDFAKIEDLNYVLQNETVGFSEVIGGKPTFKVKGKQLSYFFGTRGEPLEDASEYESMKDMFAYQINFSFERKIGKADFENLVIADSKYLATFSSSIMDVPALDPKKPIIFKLK